MGNCVPHAIATATGLDYDLVVARAVAHGWSAQDGMYGVAGWHVLRSLGVKVSALKLPEGKLYLEIPLTILGVISSIVATGFYCAHCALNTKPKQTN